MCYKLHAAYWSENGTIMVQTTGDGIRFLKQLKTLSNCN